MKNLITFFTKQGLFGILLAFFVILVGMVALSLIRREVFPNVAFDALTVSTPYPGATALETERLVTNPLEQEIKPMDGIKTLESHSVENRSLIIVMLDPDDTSEEDAKTDLRDIVDRVKPNLPEDAEEPTITSMESRNRPVIEVALLSSTLSEIDLRRKAKDVQEELENLDGVARIETFGLKALEIRVETNLKKLARFQLTLEDLVKALKSQNLSVPGGTIEADKNELDGVERLVRTTGQFENLEDVRNTVVRANELGRGITVGQIAKVKWDLEKATILNHTDGVPSIRLQVVKKEKADAITLVDKVQEKMDTLKDKLSPDVSFTYINDTSYLIRRRLKILSTNLAVGLGLVLVILSLLLPWRVALIVSIGIPFSFFGTMVLFNAWDTSINLISMIGLIIVSGMLVDDAIVITDNCVQKMEKGASPIQAAIEGAYEIWIPVTAAVLTTIVVFLPMMFMSGIFGKFVKEIPRGVIIALLFSLVEAFFILPGHIAKWVRPKDALQGRGKFNAFWENTLVPLYLRVLRQTLRLRWAVAPAVFVIFLATMFGAYKMRFILFPGDDIEIFMLRVEAPTGTPLKETEKRFKHVEKVLNEIPEPELKNYITTVGLQSMENQVAKRGGEYVQATVYLTPPNTRERGDAEIIEEVRNKLKVIPGLKNLVFKRINPGPPTGEPISLGIRAKEYEDIVPVVSELKTYLGNMNGVTDIEDTYILGKKELSVRVNPEEASAAGISVAELGSSVRGGFEGIIATTVRKIDEEIDVRVSLTQKERASGETLKNLPIPNRLGNRIPLSRVAQIEETQGLAEYAHEDNQRQIKITAQVDEAVTTSRESNSKLRELIPQLREKHPKVSIDFGGEDEDTRESLLSLARAFGIAFLGVILLLVLAFQRLIQPLFLIGFVTIPMGMMSVVWAFGLHGKPLTFMGLLGVVALSGVIVNNAIVFIDFVNKTREKGVTNIESLIQAGKARIRPIVLTTITTAVGLLPTTYGIGGLDPFVVYITMALSWGLLFGSFLTSLVLPVAFACLDDVEGLFKGPKAEGRRRL